MTEVIPATGAMLPGIFRARHDSARNGLTRRAHTQLHTALKKTPWGERSQRTFVLVRSGSVLASAECYDMHGMLNGRSFPLVGIGSVCCEPSSRGSAAAVVLIESLSRDTETPLTLLFPSAALNDLEVEGFDPMPRTEVIVRVIEDMRRGAPMPTVRGGEARDLPAIAAMGRTRADGFRFCLEREPDFIQYVMARQRLLAGLGSANTRELQFFIAEEGVTAAAYVAISAANGTWTLEECGDRDPTGARVGALLQALIAREPSLERPEIRTSLPPGFLPPQMAIVSSQPAASVIRMAARRNVATFGPGDVLYWPNDVL
ncbi:MAG TPA: hypothetical protein VMZ90_12605 [Vicinamibacterales bacterium]|nr:hypothetical protein [Vicinamibacterales bacterium]